MFEFEHKPKVDEARLKPQQAYLLSLCTVSPVVDPKEARDDLFQITHHRDTMFGGSTVGVHKVKSDEQMRT